jgi:hypothetical protein
VSVHHRRNAGRNKVAATFGLDAPQPLQMFASGTDAAPWEPMRRRGLARRRRKRAPPKSGEPTMLHFNKINLCGIILFLTGNDTQKFGDGLMKATDATLVLPMRIRPLSRRRAKPRL